MDEPIKQETVIPEKSFEALPCPECEVITRHKILAVTKAHWGDDYVDSWHQYQIIQCQGCTTISFCDASQFSEDWDIDPETNEQYLPTKRTLFPERVNERYGIHDDHLLPEVVLKIYEQTLSALNSNLNVMTGFGIRAIVEAICKDKKIAGGDLKTKIDNLQAGGYVTADGTTILHSLRFMGNNAVHEMKEHDIKELNAAFDVIDHMLHGVYVLPELAKKLPKQK